MARHISMACIIGLALVGLTACAQPHTENPAKEGGNEKQVEKLVKGNNSFAVRLYARLADDAGKDNLFVSPYSVSSAVAMTYAGARGETAAQIESVLALHMVRQNVHRAFAALNKKLRAPGEDAPYELSTANALWGQEGYDFLDDFIRVTREYYGAGLRRVDYRTAPARAPRRPASVPSVAMAAPSSPSSCPAT